jgi:BirA family biotin operon repressor/biotin-[acetyl-CoA-carboxylase] ligase
MENITLENCLRQLVEHGTLSADQWPAGEHTPEELGLERNGDSIQWHQAPDLLDQQKLDASIEGVHAETYHVIDSTNSELLRRAGRESINHHVVLAEFQYGGRGRRGRTWLSPYGRNLSMSLGMATDNEMSKLGGLSVVVGIALASELQELGVDAVALKWPNDVLVDDKKICGILVELVQREKQVEYVVGVGVNVALTDEEILQIGQPVTDLARHGVSLSRTTLVIHMINSLRRHLAHFEQQGFAPFVQAFNTIHKFHEQPCRLILPKQTIVGKAVGIGQNGELLLETGSGIEAFHGGEVSLRGLD